MNDGCRKVGLRVFKSTFHQNCAR